MENNYHFSKIEAAIKYITAHYKEQPSLDDIASSVHLSKFHFQRLFQKWAGVSPKQFLQFITAEHAKKCLIAGQTTLHTSYDVGLSGSGRLHDLFINIEACTPGEYKKRGKGLNIQYGVISTPFGSALVAETNIGICKLLFIDPGTNPEKHITEEYPESHLIQGLGKYGQLAYKFFNSIQAPSAGIKLDLIGTQFQVNVWKALLKIPSGRLAAYNHIAVEACSPTAVRAVGSAIGRNPVAYLIPCHRVIRQSGQFGEYRWGRHLKTAIIGYESSKVYHQSVRG